MGRVPQGKRSIAVFKVGALGPGGEKALGVAGVLHQLIFLVGASVLGDELFLVIERDPLVIGLEGEHSGGMGERDTVAVGFKLDQGLGGAFHAGQDETGIIIGFG